MSLQKSLLSGEPAWLVRIRNAPTIAVLSMLIGAIVGFSTMLDSVFNIRHHFTKSESFVLAEESAKSDFSDQLAQRAWRRLFWADNFSARVLHRASISDIDASWKKYIDSDADWNANIMISIVGLEQHYNVERSRMLEDEIQPLFKEPDDALGDLRKSDFLNELRSGQNIDANAANAAAANVKLVKDKSESLHAQLYKLVRCFAQEDKTRLDTCS